MGAPLGAPQGLAGGAAPLPNPAGSRVAILAPLTGPYAGVATELVNAAKLGLGATGASGLDVLDTGGTPQGAVAAAQKAIADGAGVIIGPLTNSEAAAVAGVTGPAHVDVLALTSDSSVAKPGLWALGITPAEQVRALTEAASTQGHGQLAALLPENPLGDAMGRALQSAGGGGQVQTYASGSFSSMNAALRSLSDYAGRRGPIDAQIKSLRGSHTVDGRREAAKLARTPIPPPPFQALLVAETGSGLGELASLMPYYDVNPGPVLVLGPGLWAANPAAVAAAGFRGALYAAPDPATAASFQSSYAQAYGGPPSNIAAIAFDAGAIARVTTQNGQINQAALTNPSGFAGADGLVALGADGSVKRGLAVFQVSQDGAQIVQPAPTSFAPGS
ncbi:penicillin-binding protein activator [Acidisoma cellulosilytica]|uniref:Penicillin-binding protein activator n=1 Tax=Acidisoma cellulosilyticum TaxID=2802395 RepID=A0A963Z4H9_9PROT|nr:penicillin-binding protein activator [Acidisoma cellulosilyticum]MCB8882311.1 penicillin-binding protein activator [Acidisoma cellulosilyticum]